MCTIKKWAEIDMVLCWEDFKMHWSALGILHGLCIIKKNICAGTKMIRSLQTDNTIYINTNAGPLWQSSCTFPASQPILSKALNYFSDEECGHYLEKSLRNKPATSTVRSPWS